MPTAIIIGGGIAGLTTALALQQLGLDARVYESAPEIKSVGAGIWMAPNAMQIFHRLGIADKINEGGVPLTNIQVVDGNMKPLLKTNQLEIKTKFGYTTTALKRSVLQHILLNEVGTENVVLNKMCVSVHEENSKVIIRFADGSEVSTDYIIAADGIRSRIRTQLFPDVSIRTTDFVVWRGMAEIELKSDFKKCITEAWEGGYRFGFSEVKDNVVDWFAVQKNDALYPGNNGLKKSLMTNFKNFSYPVQMILDATDEASIIKNEIADMIPLKHWSKGKICLIGDAAHATTPYTGQGGCQAIEDAYVIAQCLQKFANVEDAFQHFQKIRKAKATSVVNMSRIMGRIGYLQNSAASLRNFVMRHTPLILSQQQFCKVYSLNF